LLQGDGTWRCHTQKQNTAQYTYRSRTEDGPIQATAHASADSTVVSITANNFFANLTDWAVRFANLVHPIFNLFPETTPNGETIYMRGKQKCKLCTAAISLRTDLALENPLHLGRTSAARHSLHARSSSDRRPAATNRNQNRRSKNQIVTPTWSTIASESPSACCSASPRAATAAAAAAAPAPESSPPPPPPPDMRPPPPLPAPNVEVGQVAEMEANPRRGRARPDGSRGLPAVSSRGRGTLVLVATVASIASRRHSSTAPQPGNPFRPSVCFAAGVSLCDVQVQQIRFARWAFCRPELLWQSCASRVPAIRLSCTTCHQGRPYVFEDTMANLSSWAYRTIYICV